MAEYVEVARTGDLADGALKAVRASGREILLARVGDAFHAVQLRCPHLGANLAEGRLDGTVVTCPRHGSQFDLRDGSVVRWTEWSGVVLAVASRLRSPRPLTTHEVRVEQERVLVRVD